MRQRLTSGRGLLTPQPAESRERERERERERGGGGGVGCMSGKCII